MKLKITVDGKAYEVEVEVPEVETTRPMYVSPPSAGRSPTPTKPTAPTAGNSSAGGAKDVDERKVCRSPISGVVVRINSQPGQAIQVNDVLIVLEAMKMETSISSSVSGKVARVHVAVGDSVRGGQLLVEFE